MEVWLVQIQRHGRHHPCHSSRSSLPCRPLFSLSTAMAQTRDATCAPHKPKPSTPTVLACFGLSRKISKRHPPDDHMVDFDSGGLRNSRRCCSLAGLRPKRSTAKTVPVDSSTVSDKVKRRASAKPDNKIGSKRQIPSAGADLGPSPAGLPDHTVSEKPQKTKIQTARKSLDSSKPNNPEAGAVRRTGASQPGSPANTASTALSHSAPLPVPKQKKQAAGRGGDSNKSHWKSDAIAGEVDPVVGMSILMVTLVIMLLWGRLCAILCTSAWFYALPRIRRAVGSDGIATKDSNSGGSDLNSEEYKKKVVLEGFLERTRRNGFGIP